MAFDADVGGHHFVLDAKSEHGGEGRGATPKEVLLASLAGCTAMDVIAILRKMRQEPTTFAVRAEGTPTDGPHPRTLVDLVVTYEVTGEVAPDRLWRAVRLSQDTYCGVSAMLRKHTPLRARVLLNGVELPEPPAEP
jgi:putative redox protein